MRTNGEGAGLYLHEDGDGNHCCNDGGVDNCDDDRMAIVMMVIPLRMMMMPVKMLVMMSTCL